MRDVRVGSDRYESGYLQGERRGIGKERCVQLERKMKGVVRRRGKKGGKVSAK